MGKNIYTKLITVFRPFFIFFFIFFAVFTDNGPIFFLSALEDNELMLGMFCDLDDFRIKFRVLSRNVYQFESIWGDIHWAFSQRRIKWSVLVYAGVKKMQVYHLINFFLKTWKTFVLFTFSIVFTLFHALLFCYVFAFCFVIQHLKFNKHCHSMVSTVMSQSIMLKISHFDCGVMISVCKNESICTDEKIGFIFSC